MSDVEKLANYDKLKTELEKEKSKSKYWKNEHFVLSSNHTKQAKEIKELKKENERLIEENTSLKKIIAEVNRGNNEKLK